VSRGNYLRVFRRTIALLLKAIRSCETQRSRRSCEFLDKNSTKFYHRGTWHEGEQLDACLVSQHL
jgi:hypothetical protein